MTQQRDDRGQFIEGNQGGPGRPPREQEVAYLKSLTDRVTLENWEAIVDQAITDALVGDRHARDWLSKYLLPKATAESEGGPATLCVELRRKLGLDDPAPELREKPEQTRDY